MHRSALLVCGSLQAASANQAILDVVTEHLATVDVEAVDAVSVGELPPFNPDEQDRPGPAVERLRQQIAAAQTVAISAPEYAAALPGALKNALDWIVGSGEFYGKPVAVFSAGTSGGGFARGQLIRSLTWQGAHIVGDLGVSAPKTKSDAEGRLTCEDTKRQIIDVVDVLVSAPELPAAERLELVERVTVAAGVEPGHIAPVPQ